MAIICPQCGAGYDVTLFQFGHEILCKCGRPLTYPGEDMRSGHRSDAAREADASDKDTEADQGGKEQERPT